jgi:hypothetical protein
MSKANQTTSSSSKSRRPTALNTEADPDEDEPPLPPLLPPPPPPPLVAPVPPFPPWGAMSPPCSFSCPAASMQRKMTWCVGLLGTEGYRQISPRPLRSTRHETRSKTTHREAHGQNVPRALEGRVQGHHPALARQHGGRRDEWPLGPGEQGPEHGAGAAAISLADPAPPPDWCGCWCWLC